MGLSNFIIIYSTLNRKYSLLSVRLHCIIPNCSSPTTTLFYQLLLNFSSIYLSFHLYLSITFTFVSFIVGNNNHCSSVKIINNDVSIYTWFIYLIIHNHPIVHEFQTAHKWWHRSRLCDVRLSHLRQYILRLCIFQSCQPTNSWTVILSPSSILSFFPF